MIDRLAVAGAPCIIPVSVSVHVQMRLISSLLGVLSLAGKSRKCPVHLGSGLIHTHIEGLSRVWVVAGVPYRSIM